MSFNLAVVLPRWITYCVNCGTEGVNPPTASILGKSTSSCLQNGFVLGTASLLDGLAERFCAELGPQTAFYATGNLPIPIREACCTPILYRETLITDGLYRIWMKNKKG